MENRVKPLDSDNLPIRVLHILEATLGGTLRYLENIAEATQDSPIVSGIAYGFSRADSRFQPFLERVRMMGWRTYAIDMRRDIRFQNDVVAFRELRTAIQAFDPGVVHCHSSKAGALGRAAMVLRRKRFARVYSPHALAAPLGSRYLKIEQFLAKFTDRFIAVSDSERDEIVGFSLASKDNVSVVYPTIDSSHFIPSSLEDARRGLGLGANPLVVSIGRLTVQKNPEAFVEIVRRVHLARPDVRGIWVGSGSGELDLRELVKKAGMESVIRIVSWQHDVREYIAAADIVLSPSLFESFGYIAAEALSMERPVVASDVTGTRDIMKGDLRQWLYPVNKPDRAAELILDLLNSPDQSSKAGQLGRFEIETRFSKDRMREELIRSYIKTLEDLK